MQHQVADRDHGRAPADRPDDQTHGMDAAPALHLDVAAAGAGRGRRLAPAPGGAIEDQRHVDDRRAHDPAQADQEHDLSRRIAGFEPADRDEVGLEQDAEQAARDRRQADAGADDHAGAEGRGRELDRAEDRDLGRRDAADQAARDAAAEQRHRALQQHRVGERAQDVGHRQARRKDELHAVDQDRRVEHADAGAEHADREQVGDQLPHRRLRQAEPDHRLDQHAHRAHARDRRRRRLDVVGAVLAVGAVAVGDGRAEQAREHLAADEEADREVHVRRRQPAERAEDEDAEREQQRVVLPGVLRRQPAPARRGQGGGFGGRERDRAHVDGAMRGGWTAAGSRRRLRRLAPRMRTAPTTVKRSIPSE